jgi:diguanylate cyclase (GGDEF)-like protein
MLEEHAEGAAMSSRARHTLARWTILGTIGCLSVAMAFNAALFWRYDAEVFRLGMVSATVLPLILAGPLFFYLTLKLRELAIANHRLGDIASRDALTGCLNRGAFTTTVSAWLANRRRANDASGGAFLILDADCFKSINDRFGHQEGDLALQLIASAVRSSVRASDVVGRLGGEEFGVLLPDASTAKAKEVANRIARAVEQAATEHAAGRYELTVSTGCAIFSDNLCYRAIFAVADRKLYEAKRAGRNRVIVADVPPIAADSAIMSDRLEQATVA